jgi:hypothetical protein
VLERVQPYPVACRFLCFTVSFVEKTILSSSLNGLGNLVKNHLTIYFMVFPVLLYHIGVCVSLYEYGFAYCCFVVSFEIIRYEFATFVL